MSDRVTLMVPVAEPYRGLGSELARKYVELAGGSPDAAKTLADLVSAAVTQAGAAAAADTGLTVAFELDTGGVEASVRCGAHSTVVTQPLPVRHPS